MCAIGIDQRNCDFGGGQLQPRVVTQWASNGVASFDGVTATITGSRVLQVGARLSPTLQTASDPFSFSIGGELGRRYLIEASSDLAHWTTLGSVTNVTGRVQFRDAAGAGLKHRFYRVQAQ